jgi:UDP-N-acetyl-D-mannosaminuronic acid dehydrogenase
VTVDGSLISLEDVLAQSDILIIGAPHREYATLTTTTELVDVWNLLGQGTRV